VELPDDDPNIVCMKPASHAMQANRFVFEKLNFGCAFANLTTNNAEEKKGYEKITPENETNEAGIDVPIEILHAVNFCDTRLPLQYIR
jgi:hypothetical protein